MKKYFIDSSILIGFCKNNAKAVNIFDKLNTDGNSFYINPIVVSEVSYILKKRLKMKITDIIIFFNNMQILSVDSNTIELAFGYMQKHKTRPNDAIIAATCKLHKITNLVSIDNDFISLCEEENIHLINKQ